MNTLKVKKLKLNVNIQNPAQFTPLPAKRILRKWLCGALAETLEDVEITIRFVSEEESQYLNTRYRQQAKPTNVLSFNYSDAMQLHAHQLMGDLALCGPVIVREAVAENKPIEFHLAHLLIHGALHLQGYDHETDADAEVMQAKEIAVLKELQFPNPYLVDYDQEKS